MLSVNAVATRCFFFFPVQNPTVLNASLIFGTHMLGGGAFLTLAQQRVQCGLKSALAVGLLGASAIPRLPAKDR